MDGQFIGTAGTYFVMSKLASKEIHASCTHGNAPNIDILACSADGSTSISLQVKTAFNAKRWTGRGTKKELSEFGWFIGRKAAKANSDNLFFAFVDMNENQQPPTVFLIPSEFIYNYCKSWIDSYESNMVRFQGNLSDIEQFKENWDIIKKALIENK